MQPVSDSMGVGTARQLVNMRSKVVKQTVEKLANIGLVL